MCRSYAAKLIRSLNAKLGSGGLSTGQQSHGRSHQCGKAPENLLRVVRMLAERTTVSPKVLLSCPPKVLGTRVPKKGFRTYSEKMQPQECPTLAPEFV